MVRNVNVLCRLETVNVPNCCCSFKLKRICKSFLSFVITADNRPTVADYLSTKLIYYCGSQSDQPRIAIINRRFVHLAWHSRLHSLLCSSVLVVLMWICERVNTIYCSLTTLLVGWQEEHLARKQMSDEVLVWLSLWSKVQLICIWSSCCHWSIIISCFIKIQNGSAVCYWLTEVVLEKRTLNRCCCCCNALLFCYFTCAC